jgi:hypothetical protein
MLIVKPDGTPADEFVGLVPVPDTKALVVGILDNRKDNAQRLLMGMRSQLIARVAARIGAAFQKSYVNIPAKVEAIVGLAESCNLVLVGSGD